MNLVWKLLRRHVSIPQFAGFFFANLFGMLIVLLGFQFYRDILPVFTEGDSFMKADYLIVSKKIAVANTLSGRSNAFSNIEFDDLAEQKFVKNIGRFTSAEYKIDASMGINGTNLLNSEISFESIPDAFVGISAAQWNYDQGGKTIPIILPRSYITMYNFGFAQKHSLPKISDGLVGMIDLCIFIHGNGHRDEYKGKVIGFSNRLNTILVPQSFMEWSNARYAPAATDSAPSRLILEVANPADENIAKYIERKGYEVEDNNLAAEKTTYFLKLVVVMVMAVGLVISLLSFYILMLSIYLLVQKNSSKLENLLLIGYSPSEVALPYQALTVCLNAVVLLIALAVLYAVRRAYMDVVVTLFPSLPDGSLLPSLALGLLLFVVVSLLNTVAIRLKILHIWHRRA